MRFLRDSHKPSLCWHLPCPIPDVLSGCLIYSVFSEPLLWKWCHRGSRELSPSHFTWRSQCHTTSYTFSKGQRKNDFLYLTRKPFGWKMEGWEGRHLLAHRFAAAVEGPVRRTLMWYLSRTWMVLVSLQSRHLSFSFPRNEALKVYRVGEKRRVLG